MLYQQEEIFFCHIRVLNVDNIMEIGRDPFLYGLVLFDTCISTPAQPAEEPIAQLVQLHRLPAHLALYLLVQWMKCNNCSNLIRSKKKIKMFYLWLLPVSLAPKYFVILLHRSQLHCYRLSSFHRLHYYPTVDNRYLVALLLTYSMLGQWLSMRLFRLECFRRLPVRMAAFRLNLWLCTASVIMGVLISFVLFACNLNKVETKKNYLRYSVKWERTWTKFDRDYLVTSWIALVHRSHVIHGCCLHVIHRPIWLMSILALFQTLAAFVSHLLAPYQV